MENMYKTEEGNFVSFEYGTDRNNGASDERGRPIYDKVLKATVVAPGQAKSRVVYEVERTFENGETRIQKHVYNRFEKYIERFKKDGESGDLNGTPIDQWPQIDIRQAATLKSLNVHTVESLVELSDTGLQQLGMGSRQLQAKAKAFLDAASGGAGYEKMAAENEKLKEKLDRLEKQMSELSEKKSSGRPKKKDE